MRTYRHTVTVELPGGVMDGQRAITNVELRSLTGREEQWLAEDNGAPAAVVVSALLKACIVRAEGARVRGNLVYDLPAGDRDYLMLELRRITLGNRVQAVIDCPACASRMDVDFLVGDVVVERRPQTALNYRVELPGRTVTVRLPNGGDQEFVAALPLPAAVDALLDRCILEQEALSREEREAAIAAMEDLAPRVDLELDLTCPECGHKSLASFDTTSFFIQEMRAQRQQLLREVHSLAVNYHWSEAEILGMARSRRRSYLEMLSDAAPH